MSDEEIRSSKHLKTITGVPNLYDIYLQHLSSGKVNTLNLFFSSQPTLCIHFVELHKQGCLCVVNGRTRPTNLINFEPAIESFLNGYFKQVILLKSDFKPGTRPTTKIHKQVKVSVVNFT